MTAGLLLQLPSPRCTSRSFLFFLSRSSIPLCCSPDRYTSYPSSSPSITVPSFPSLAFLGLAKWTFAFSSHSPLLLTSLIRSLVPASLKSPLRYLLPNPFRCSFLSLPSLLDCARYQMADLLPSFRPIRLTLLQCETCARRRATISTRMRRTKKEMLRLFPYS